MTPRTSTVELTTVFHRRIAQMGERSVYTRKVTGSIPVMPTSATNLARILTPIWLWLHVNGNEAEMLDSLVAVAQN